MDNFSQQNQQSFANCKFNANRDVMINMLTWGSAEGKRNLGILSIASFLALVLIVALGSESVVLIGIFLFLSMLLGMSFLMQNKIIQKNVDKFIKTKGLSFTTIDFYDSYMIVGNQREVENNAILVAYDKIKSSVQQDGYIYFTFRRDGSKKTWASCVCIDALQGDVQRVLQIFSNVKNFSQKTTVQHQPALLSDKTRVFLIALFVLTILSLWIAPMIANMLVQSSPLPQFTGTFPEKMWVCWALLPIPVLSICLGVYFGKKGYKAKKNVVAGFVIAVLLVLFGCFSVFIKVEHDMAFLNEIEAVTSMTLPDQGDISVIEANESNPETQALARFYDEQKTQFENMVSTDDRWQNNVNGFYSAIGLYHQAVTQEYDKFCFYDVTNKTFNNSNLPTSSFVFMAYDMQDGLLYIIYV